MSLKKTILEQAIKITSAYEGSGFDMVTGNFDGQGLSYGFLQWNFGQGTLQPIFQSLFVRYPDLAKSLPDDSLRLAIQNNTAIAWAVAHQANNKFKEPWLSALKRLGGTAEMKSLQMTAANPYIQTAINQCGQFGVYTDRAFCLLFDIAVQCGSAPYVSTDGLSDTDKLIAIVNATVARSNPEWKEVVRTRKMAIVYGTGIVYGGKVSYTFYDSGAFYDDKMAVPLTTLVAKGVINSKDYWMEYADGNIPCNGEYCGILLMNATKTSDLVSAVDSLKLFGLTNSPQHWLDNAQAGRTVLGKNMKSMIYRLVG